MLGSDWAGLVDYLIFGYYFPLTKDKALNFNRPHRPEPGIIYVKYGRTWLCGSGDIMWKYIDGHLDRQKDRQ